jgi:hypothetical protein
VRQLSNPDSLPVQRIALARGALLVTIFAIAVIVVVGVLDGLDVGLSDPGPIANEISQQIIDVAVAHEEWYLMYGRWEALAVAVAFAGLLVAIPFVRGTHRSRHLVMAGAAIAIVAEMIDLSQLVGINLVRFTLENGLTTDFTAANTYRFAINGTAVFVLAAGLFLTAVGMLVVANDAGEPRWKLISALFAISLLATVVADLFGSLLWLDVATYVLAVLAVSWIVSALGRLEDHSTGVRSEAHPEPADL